MSYLAKVLATTEEVNWEKINTKIPELTTVTENLKSEVTSYLENIYVRFAERPKQNRVLTNKAVQLEEEMSILKQSIEDVTKRELSESKVEMKDNIEAYEKLALSLTVIDNMCKIHEALIEIKELQESTYLACMEKILDVENMINSTLDINNLDIFEELVIRVNIEKNTLLNTLSNLFRDNVILHVEAGKSVMKVKHELVSEILSAMYLNNVSIHALHEVTRFLWNHVFVPLVDMTTEVRIHKNDDFVSMEIITVDPNKKASYIEVFSNIKTVLNFLNDNLNFSLSENVSSLSYIGEDIRDNLSELIIKHCLQDTIPSTAEGLENYNVVIEATHDLEQSLISSRIFAEDTTSILEYANNIDILFINKKCQEYLLKAQTLMKKDLHDMVEIGTADRTQSDLGLSNEFPQCSVSKSVLELIHLIEKMLIEATTSSDVIAGRLFVTVQNICLKYGTFVPEYHKKLLQTIPQQVGLFHNNCSYIAYKLTEWNDSYLKKFSSTLELQSNSFSDEGHQLQEVSSEMFTVFIKGQISQIEEIMKQSGLTLHQTLEQVETSIEKSVRQCLRQQELLKTVWHKVLPYMLYNKTIGTILDVFCNSLITSIIKFEDISSNAAEQLVELLKMVQTRGPKLFTDPKEVSLFVRSWYKLAEVVFVLNSSLLDINDRWADGKGPLALQFKPEELKQLIRALFQNTERRAALLAKIHIQ